MKKLLFCTPIILLALLFSCSQANSNKDRSAGNDSSTANNANAERDRMIANDQCINKAIETGNFNGIDTLWTDDIVDHTGPNGKEVRGKDSVKAALMQMAKSMKDIKIDSKSTLMILRKGICFLYPISVPPRLLLCKECRQIQNWT
ncbi:MAG: nuclear transport factor 2 family protein [Segetibacter sp.]